MTEQEVQISRLAAKVKANINEQQVIYAELMSLLPAPEIKKGAFELTCPGQLRKSDARKHHHKRVASKN